MSNQEEKILSPEESLRVIRETIDLAKNSIRENGFHFLLWGWLVVLACLTEYYLLNQGYGDKSHLAWTALPLLGAPAAILYESRRKKLPYEQNIVRKWYGLIWMAFGISLLAGLVLSVFMKFPPAPIIMILAAFATFLSGVLLRFTPLVFGAIVFWGGALVCLALPIGLHGLVQAGATVLGYLVPGYLLNAQARKRHV